MSQALQTMSRDMKKLQLSQSLSRDKNILSRDMSFMSRRSVAFTHLESCNTCTFSFVYFCSVARYDINFCCLPVYYKTLIL